MQRRFIFSLGEYYHLYNRGVEKRQVFLDESDHNRFTKLLYVANSEQSFVFRDIEQKPFSEIQRGESLTSIGAYVLMPNHFHILVRETSDHGISRFMEKLLTAYSSYFNKRNSRVGPLFQGTFKAQHVDNDEYLKYLFAYIHLNPVKMIDPNWRTEGLKNNRETKCLLENYPYSSYLDYVGVRRQEFIILTTEAFPKYFSNSRELKDFLDDWLMYKQYADPNT